MSMCRVFSCVVGRVCFLWPVRSLGKTLLAFALLHSVLQGQIFILCKWNTKLTEQQLPISSFPQPLAITILFSVAPIFTVFSSVLFSHSVVSNSLWPHQSQHTRPPCPSPTPRVHADWCSSSQWCHPAISSSVVPFFSCPQSLPASESFPISQHFTWGGQTLELQL